MRHHPTLLCYTKKGESEIEKAVFFAVSKKEGHYNPLLHDTGIVFPKADFSRNPLKGVTRVLDHPYLIRSQNGFLLAAHCEGVDGSGKNEVTLFFTEDLLTFCEAQTIALTPQNERVTDLFIEDTENGICVFAKGETEYWYYVRGNLENGFSQPKRNDQTGKTQKQERRDIPDNWIAGNEIDLSEEEAECLEKYYNALYPVEKKKTESFLNIQYNDGSTETFSLVPDVSESHESPEKIQMKSWEFPFLENRADPMICRIEDRYYFMATDDENGQLTLKIRGADSIDGLKKAEDHIIFRANSSGEMSGCIWAPELHFLNGKPYIFFAAGNPYWYTVQSYVLPGKGGDLLKESNWEKPQRVQKRNGDPLTQTGISLDMTAKIVNEELYLVWAQREMSPDGEFGEHGTSDLMIALAEKDRPWILKTEPVCLSRPEYGWERIDATVEEGPFFIEHGDDLFLSFSGSSVSVYYCVGLLQINKSADLLDPANWKKYGYPVLKTEFVPKQFGPGHNAYFKDEEGTDYVIFHAKTPPKEGIDAGMVNRHAGIRRVHWDAFGRPRLEMERNAFVEEAAVGKTVK